MKRAGFTMIELIFVIVILGILAAVALPKFIGVSEQARAAKCDAFYGTLNRTVAPALWTNMVVNGQTAAVAFTPTTIGNQIDIPTGTDSCGTAAEIVAGATAGTDYTVVVSGVTYDVNVSEANATSSPIWGWSKPL